jgi:hypothetical protein
LKLPYTYNMVSLTHFYIIKPIHLSFLYHNRTATQ